MDWNNDGKKDLLVGESSLYAYLYINEGTEFDPVLGGGTIVAWTGQRVAPYVVDWNEDGKKDLLVGEKTGLISLLINENTDDDPQFPDQSLNVLAGFEDLDVGERSNPEMPDWNNDGKKDLISGEYYGNIYIYLNIGTNSDPDFGPREQMKAGSAVVDVGTTARIDVVDWNNDGLLDVLSGCKDGFVYYFEQEFIFKFESISYEPGVGTRLVWRSRSGESYTVYYSDDTENWTTVPGEINSGGVTTEWVDTSSTGATRRIYKVSYNE